MEPKIGDPSSNYSNSLDGTCSHSDKPSRIPGAISPTISPSAGNVSGLSDASQTVSLAARLREPLADDVSYDDHKVGRSHVNSDDKKRRTQFRSFRKLLRLKQTELDALAGVSLGTV